MFDFHRGLGEILFVIYAIVIAVVLLLDRRGKAAPSWLIGGAHGLLALQVAVGVILITDDSYDAPWYHPVLGILALLSLGLASYFRKRLAGVYATVAPLAVAGVLALITMLSIVL